MNPLRLIRLCQKELRETLRDRRTIITLFLMPLLVYPLLSMALNRFLLASGSPQGEAYSVGVGSEQDAQLLDLWINSPPAKPPSAVLDASEGKIAKFDIMVTEAVDPLTALDQNAIDVAAIIERNTDNSTAAPSVTFYAFRGDASSAAARRILVERLQWYTLRDFQRRSTDSRPAVQVSVDAIGELESGSMLSTIIPLVLVLMTITGAVYPAIDLTAGERERGTMEVLMASPVPRSAVLFAKYIAVVSVALLTAIANLLAMFTTLWAARLLPLITGDDAGFPWLAILQILALLVLFSGFFAAILLSLTSFARSFKEAQSYLIPVMLLSLAPGMLSLMPGVRLEGPLAIAPLINIVLLARDVLSSSVSPASAATAVLSTLAYAAAAIGIAAKLFGSDAVSRTSGQSFGAWLRRPQQATPVPSPQAAALMMATLVPVYFLVSNGLMQLLQDAADQIGMSQRLVFNAVALAGTFGLVPLAAAVIGRNQLTSTFRIHHAKIGGFVGAVLMGLGAWAFAHEAFVLADAAGIRGMDTDKINQTLKILDAWKQVSPVLLLATLAATPAIIEELCFRGYLFSSIRKILSPSKTILVTAVLFGLFHVLTGNMLLLERFIPSTLLGILLGWIAHRTGSVIPGMIMHFVHNGLLELAGKYHEDLSFLGDQLEKEGHLPASWLVVAGAVAIAGALVVIWSTRNDPGTAAVDDL